MSLSLQQDDEGTIEVGFFNWSFMFRSAWLDWGEFQDEHYVTLGTLRSDDGDGNGNATKAIGLIHKTTILHVHHAFLYISLPSLHDYNVKMPNFTMYRGTTEATTKFPLSFWTWIWFLGIQL